MVQNESTAKAVKTKRTCKSTRKSGCRTCKLRKVKCDEAFPVCKRCQTAGRVCEGYGIWGGGSGAHGSTRQQPGPSNAGYPTSTKTLSNVPTKSLSLLTTSREEAVHLDWFKHRTAAKLPASFLSKFWSILLLQASSSEPAVLHAVIALSSVQRRAILQPDRQCDRTTPPDKEEQFTLQHYGKAIRNLQHYFQTQDLTSFRIALISCIVFVSMDFLRGHFNTGQLHLENGVRLLEEAKSISSWTTEPLCLRPGRESVDDWIVESLSRLHTQVQLFRQPYQQPCFLFTGYSCTPAWSFRSLKEAWLELDRLLNVTFHLSRQARAHNGTPIPNHLYDQQATLKSDLIHWLTTYQTFTSSLPSHFSSLEEQRAYGLPPIHHSMATIMASVCLSPSQESAYDAHTPLFVHLLAQFEVLRAMGGELPVPPPPGHRIDMAHSIVDLGGTALLYFAAVKCRVHKLRWEAVRQLEARFHREGIWDAKVTARVARKVVEVEEEGFYDGWEGMDGEMPALPEEYRLRDVEMVVVGEPTERVLIYCTRERDGRDERVCVAEYRLATQRWLDLDIL